MTIDRVTLNDPEARSADPVAENVAALKALFPAAVADGRIDFDVLRQLLGDEVDDGDERYGLNWPGKRRARRLALTPSTGTLRPAREDSVDWDKTRNLMIEGDNLEVLKLLQKSYAGKIDLIYIDPPYNTGSDLVYPDDYSDNISNYLKRTGQANGDNLRTTSNAEAGGRFHSNWLDMIFPRLVLARTMLSPKGAIAISIDGREVDAAKLVCDSVFGEEAFIGRVVRATGTTTGQDSGGFGSSFDFLLCYSRDVDFEISGIPLTEEDAKRFQDTDERGAYSVLQLRKTGNADRREDRPSMWYPVKAPDGTEVYPIGPTGYESRWRFGPEKYRQSVSENMIVWKQDSANNWKPYVKYYLEGREKRPSPLWDDIDGNKKATIEVRGLLGEGAFSNPKPTQLVRRLLGVLAPTDALVMDFFAGSGTTAHAVMLQNQADGGSRRYILIQLPEELDATNGEQRSAAGLCDKLAKPRNIAEITKERLRRSSASVAKGQPKSQHDLGFRVYKLATSNLRPWDPGDDLSGALLAAADNIVQGRTEEDLLTELLLKQGIDLTEPMLTETIAGAPVHAMGGGVLVVCLAPVTAANAEALADGIADWILRLNPVAATTVFFKDAGFENDVAKANVAAILEQRLEDQLLKVRSL